MPNRSKYTAAIDIASPGHLGGILGVERTDAAAKFGSPAVEARHTVGFADNGSPEPGEAQAAGLAAAINGNALLEMHAEANGNRVELTADVPAHASPPQFEIIASDGGHGRPAPTLTFTRFAPAQEEAE